MVCSVVEAVEACGGSIMRGPRVGDECHKIEVFGKCCMVNGQKTGRSGGLQTNWDCRII